MLRSLIALGLLLLAGGLLPAADGPVLELRGLNGESAALTAAEFQTLPRIDVEATNHDKDRVKYSGVRLAVLLAKVGLPEGEPLKGDWVRRYVLVEAHDGYAAVYAVSEIDLTMTDDEVILADRCNGAPLNDHDGPLQIIAPAEKRHSRCVRQVTRLSLIEARP